MRTHHRRNVNNPFASRSHRTVGYLDHRYGNPNHHNQHTRGRKGCLCSPLTFCIILLGCISFFILPSSNFEQHSLLKESKEFENIQDDTSVGRNDEKHSHPLESSPTDGILGNETKKDDNKNDDIENSNVKENNFLSDPEKNFDEEDYNHNDDINNDLNLSEKSEPHVSFDNEEPQINEKTEKVGEVGEDQRESFHKQESNSSMEDFNLPGEREPHESDDSIYQGGLEGGNEINTSYEENRSTDKIVNESIEVLTPTDADYRKDLNKTNLNGNLQKEAVIDQIEKNDEKKENTEEGENKISMKDADTGFSDVDKNDGIVEKNLTRTTSDHSPMEDLTPTDADYRKDLNKTNLNGNLQKEAVIDQIEKTDEKKENTEEGENKVFMKDANTGFSDIDKNDGIVKKNLTRTTSDHSPMEDSITNFLNTSESLAPMPQKSNETLPSELMYTNKNETFNDEESTLANIANQNVTASTNSSNVTNGESKNFSEEGFNDTDKGESEPLFNTSGAETVAAIGFTTELLFVNETEIDSNFTGRKKSEKNRSSENSLLNSPATENVLENKTADANLRTTENSEVSGDLIKKTQESAQSNTSTTGVFNDTAPTTNFENDTIADVTNPRRNQTDINGTFIADIDSRAGTSNNMQLVMSENSTNSSELVPSENIANATTAAIDEIGRNRIGNLRGSTVD